MNENEIILTANYIKALAGKPDSDELIQHLLKQICTPSKESYPQKSVSTVSTQEKKRPARISSKQNANFWIFTKKEIDKMPQKYKKSFIVSEQRVFYRIKATGVYEARYKRKAEGIKIEVLALMYSFISVSSEIKLSL